MVGFRRDNNGRKIEAKIVNGKRLVPRKRLATGERRVTAFEHILVDETVAERFKFLASNYGMTHTDFLRYLLGEDEHNNGNGNGNGHRYPTDTPLARMLRDFQRGEGFFQ